MMQTESGELLIRGTACLMVACYVARTAIDASTRRVARGRINRWIWTAGCGLLVAHLVAAFHFFHNWSHAEAYRHTANRTAEVIGLDWGGGIWVNYAFTLFWIAEVVRWWRNRTDTLDSKAWFWTVHVIFAFMIVNATAVFGPPYWKWVFAVVVFGLAGICLLRSRNLQREHSPTVSEAAGFLSRENSLTTEE